METPPNPENIEGQIEQLLNELETYTLDQFPEEIRDALHEEWYNTEMEARVSRNRDPALERLRRFVGKLSKTPKKE